jgi:TonB family protein
MDFHPSQKCERPNPGLYALTLGMMILVLNGCATDCAIIQPPVRLSEIVPVFTEPARKARIEGRIVLKLLIDTRGNVIGLEVLRGLPMGLTDMAIEAARDLKFKPAYRVCNGVPISSHYLLTIIYKIKQHKAASPQPKAGEGGSLSRPERRTLGVPPSPHRETIPDKTRSVPTPVGTALPESSA